MCKTCNEIISFNHYVDNTIKILELKSYEDDYILHDICYSMEHAWESKTYSKTVSMLFAKIKEYNKSIKE